MKNTASYFDEDGHLNVEGRAYYIEAVENDALEKLPAVLLDHVRDCLKCTTEVEAIYQIRKTEAEAASSSARSFKIRRWNRVYRIAASLILPIAFVAAYFHLNSRYNGKVMYKTYVTVSTTENLRGVDALSGLFTEGLAAYNRQDYQRAIEVWESYPDRDMYTLFFLGRAYLAVEDMDKAIGYFQRVSDHYDFYDDECAWLQAMAYLGKGDKPQARALLQRITEEEKDPYYAMRAEEVLQKINSFWGRIF